ncbi:hypothetical protein ACP8Y2_11515 [Herpetosiphon llansteffanensis]
MSDPPVIGALESMTNSVKAWSTTPLESIFNQISPATEPTSAPYFLPAQRFSLSEATLFRVHYLQRYTSYNRLIHVSAG